MSRDFCFPQAPEYTIRSVSNFFEISQRYMQLKVHHWCRWHQWQMKKIFNHKNLIFFWHLWKVELTYRYILAFKFRTSEIGGKAGVVDTGGAPWLETVLMRYYGAGGNLIHKKNRSKKSRDTVPLTGIKRNYLHKNSKYNNGCFAATACRRVTRSSWRANSRPNQ
jgi:hypothetical protein